MTAPDAGGTAAFLREKMQGASVPIDRTPWVKLAGDAWSDGKKVVTSAELARMFDRQGDVLEGSATRVDKRQALPDPFATVRPFVADLEPEVQAAALRSAVTQMAEGRPVDITPTLLAETDYPEAMRRALANGEAVAAADPAAAQLADARVQQGEPAEQLAAVREYLADTRERLGERGEGLEWESDLKTQRDAVKAATLCMMRNA